MKQRFLLPLLLLLGLLPSQLLAQYVAIPDPGFRSYLMTNMPGCFNGAQQMDTTCSNVLITTALLLNGQGFSNIDGVQYFDNLTQLDCSNNQLTSLPTLPNSISTLDVRNNQLTTLPALPTALFKFDCLYNQLTALPALPAGLKLLDCRSNQLSSLPTLPAAMTYLVCTDNQLDSLPALPATITTLMCDGNQLTALPPLPQALFWLDCARNQLTTLPALPAGVSLVLADSNQLTSLPALNASLSDLRCSHNQLTALPALPASLMGLNVSMNPVACLPTLPPNLATLKAYQTLISCIPNYTQYLTPNTIFYPLCTGPCQAAGVNVVSGHVFADFDCDQVQDSGDVPLSWVLIGNDSSTLSASGNGMYSFLLPADTSVMFGPVSQIPGYSPHPTQDTIATDSLPQQYPGHHFAFCPDSLFDNLRVILTQVTPPRPGFSHRYALMLENRGTQAQQATLKFWFGNGLGAAETTPTQTNGATVSGDTLVWNINNLPLFQPQFMFVEFTTDAATPLGTPFLPVARIAPPVFAAENDTTDNRSTLAQTVVGSYDPNDKAVTHSLVSRQVAQQGLDLTYTIRFQNTGSYPAEQVVVRDTLDPLLDASTLQMLSASHSYELSIHEGHILQWTFNDIQLAAEMTNEPESHGFVSFVIRSKAQTTYREIGNRAAIYFDYNAPIITNTAFTEVSTSRTPAIVVRPLTLIPNPSRGEVVVQPDATMRNYMVQVLDLTGREIFSFSDQNGEVRLPTAILPAGTYLVRVTSTEGQAVARLVRE